MKIHLTYNWDVFMQRRKLSRFQKQAWFKKLSIMVLLSSAAPSALALKSIPYLGTSLGIQNTQAYTGLFASVSGGYGIITGEYRNYYFAAELFADSGSLPLCQNYYRRTNYGIGASFLPGLILRETVLAYLRVGVENFRYSTTMNHFTGGQLGIGLQTHISHKWDIRGEYVYTGKGIFRDFGTVRFNIFKLGLVYKL